MSEPKPKRQRLEIKLPQVNVWPFAGANAQGGIPSQIVETFVAPFGVGRELATTHIPTSAVARRIQRKHCDNPPRSIITHPHSADDGESKLPRDKTVVYCPDHPTLSPQMLLPWNVPCCLPRALLTPADVKRVIDAEPVNELHFNNSEMYMPKAGNHARLWARVVQMLESQSLRNLGGVRRHQKDNDEPGTFYLDLLYWYEQDPATGVVTLQWPTLDTEDRNGLVNAHTLFMWLVARPDLSDEFVRDWLLDVGTDMAAANPEALEDLYYVPETIRLYWLGLGAQPGSPFAQRIEAEVRSQGRAALADWLFPV